MPLDFSVIRTMDWLVTNINGIDITFQGMRMIVDGYWFYANQEYPIHLEHDIEPPVDDATHYQLFITRDMKPLLVMDRLGIQERLFCLVCEFFVEVGATDLNQGAHGTHWKFEPMYEHELDGLVPGCAGKVYREEYHG